MTPYLCRTRKDLACLNIKSMKVCDRKGKETLYDKIKAAEKKRKKKKYFKRIGYAYLHFFVKHFLPRILQKKEFRHLASLPLAKFLVDPDIPYTYKSQFLKKHEYMFQYYDDYKSNMYKWMRDFHKKCLYLNLKEVMKEPQKNITKIEANDVDFIYGTRTDGKVLIQKYKTLLEMFLTKPYEWTHRCFTIWWVPSRHPPYKNLSPLADICRDLLTFLDLYFPADYYQSLGRISRTMHEARALRVENPCETSEEEEEKDI